MNRFSQWWQFGKLLFLGYIVCAILVSFLSDSLIYVPPKPTSFQKSTVSLQLDINPETTISAVYLPNPQARYTVLFSHGNAEDLGTLQPFLHDYQAHGFSLFAYDYPSYGTSTGKPTEKNIFAAIATAYRYLTEVLKISPDNIIIHGRSLGCGPSIYLAARFPASGLVLESPFVSVYRVKTVLPLFPFDKYQNLNNIHQVKMPTLIMHGTQDSVAPLWHGQAIFNALEGYKQAYWVKGAGHNNIMAHDSSAYWKTIGHFLESKPQK